ncbi:MAG: hypothetical protein WDZ72_10590 [Cyclobacteriaceae bacterium]
MDDRAANILPQPQDISFLWRGNKMKESNKAKLIGIRTDFAKIKTTKKSVKKAKVKNDCWNEIFILDQLCQMVKLFVYG